MCSDIFPIFPWDYRFVDMDVIDCTGPSVVWVLWINRKTLRLDLAQLRTDPFFGNVTSLLLLVRRILIQA